MGKPVEGKSPGQGKSLEGSHGPMHKYWVLASMACGPYAPLSPVARPYGHCGCDCFLWPRMPLVAPLMACVDLCGPYCMTPCGPCGPSAPFCPLWLPVNLMNPVPQDKACLMQSSWSCRRKSSESMLQSQPGSLRSSSKAHCARC